MYAIITTASIYITSAAGCYFEDHALRLVEPNLRMSIEEVISFSKSHWSTLLDVNSLGAGTAAAMADVL